uniref:class F sortase n=1 Tax=Nocardioides sp. LHG3406-4 TaxID=2804575 RepID=UPI003CED7F35
MSSHEWPGGRSPRALVAGVVLGVVLAASGTAPGVASAPPAGAPTPAECAAVDHEFTPTALSIAGVIGPTRVLALGRDRDGVPRTPPLTDRGKWQFSWDRASRTRPGGSWGVIRLAAHTYPSFAGTALGNRLLARLRPGAQITVTGAGGEVLCYRVSRREIVRADNTTADYYSTTGRSRLAILVCSGIRRGPGNWSHRTIWYAVP